MKPENSNPDDPSVSKLLQEWRVESPLPPRFNEQVWRRIAAEEVPVASVWTLFRQWTARLTLRPSFAFAYATILLLAGLLAGVWQARADTDHTSETLSVRYVQMLDPYQMPRH